MHILRLLLILTFLYTSDTSATLADLCIRQAVQGHMDTECDPYSMEPLIEIAQREGQIAIIESTDVKSAKLSLHLANAQDSLKAIEVFNSHTNPLNGSPINRIHIYTVTESGELENKIRTLDTEDFERLSIRNEAYAAYATLGRHHALANFLARGVHIEARNKKGDNALTLAARFGHDDCIRLLLDNHIPVDIRGKHEETALHLACCNSNTICFETLIKAGAPINATDKDGDTPLILTSLGNKPTSAQQLLKFGANPDIQNDKGLTALMVATQLSHLELVEILAPHSDVDLRNADGKNTESLQPKHTSMPAYLIPLYQPLVNNPTTSAITKTLQYYRLKKRLTNDNVMSREDEAAYQNSVFSFSEPDGTTALMVAAQLGLPEAVTKILPHSKLDAMDTNGYSALDHAHNAGKQDVAKLLAGPSLFSAIKSKNAQCAQRIIDAGWCSPDIQNNGVSALATCCNAKLFDIAHDLIKIGANPNVTVGKKSQTPVMHAVYHNQPELLKALIESNAPLDAVDDNGNCALAFAATKKNTGLAQILVEAGVDPNSLNKNGDPIRNKIDSKKVAQYLHNETLMRAIYGMNSSQDPEDQRSTIEELIADGADGSCSSSNSFSPLMLTTYANLKPCVRDSLMGESEKSLSKFAPGIIRSLKHKLVPHSLSRTML